MTASSGEGVSTLVRVDGQAILSYIWQTGFYCSRGSTIYFWNVTPYIFPILQGNGLDDSFLAFKEKQTPEQITTFINDNMGENGYFQPIENATSGIFGKTTSSSEWSLINTPSDPLSYYSFGYRCQPAKNHYVSLRYP